MQDEVLRPIRCRVIRMVVHRLQFRLDLVYVSTRFLNECMFAHMLNKRNLVHGPIREPHNTTSKERVSGIVPGLFSLLMTFQIYLELL